MNRLAVPAEPVTSSREKILDAAEALFARRGFAGIGMRELAEVVGVSKSTLFHHFANKSDLYHEVLLRVLGRISERVAPILARSGSASERLDCWLDALIDALAEHPSTARLLLRGLFEEDEFADENGAAARAGEQAIAELIEGFQSLVRFGISAGEFRELSLAHVTQVLIGATVYHFASGEFGEALLGAPIYSAESVRRCKQEVSAFLRLGLAAPAANPSGMNPA
jgi:AcrR family transcriptional regulator